MIINTRFSKLVGFVNVSLSQPSLIFRARLPGWGVMGRPLTLPKNEKVPRHNRLRVTLLMRSNLYYVRVFCLSVVYTGLHLQTMLALSRVGATELAY